MSKTLPLNVIIQQLEDLSLEQLIAVIKKVNALILQKLLEQDISEKIEIDFFKLEKAEKTETVEAEGEAFQGLPNTALSIFSCKNIYNQALDAAHSDENQRLIETLDSWNEEYKEKLNQIKDSTN